MKKVLLLAAVAGLAFASCKKDYTCTCKDQTTPPDPDLVMKYHAKKADAEASCNTANTTYQILGYKCTLD